LFVEGQLALILRVYQELCRPEIEGSIFTPTFCPGFFGQPEKYIHIIFIGTDALAGPLEVFPAGIPQRIPAVELVVQIVITMKREISLRKIDHNSLSLSQLLDHNSTRSAASALSPQAQHPHTQQSSRVGSLLLVKSRKTRMQPLR
jgi:hypothetical protein